MRHNNQSVSDSVPQMRQVYIFRTDFYGPRYREFYNARQLCNFLQHINFMSPHTPSNLSVGLPMFTLGTCKIFQIEDQVVRSTITPGPRIIVALSVRIDDSVPGKPRVYALVPMDRKTPADNGLIYRVYNEILVHPSTCDAVIQEKTLNQLWPRCEKARCMLQKFFGTSRGDKTRGKR